VLNRVVKMVNRVPANMSLPNKNKTVSPLIIPKSRIQRVPNHSTENIQEDNSNDGLVTPTPTKRNQTS